jgi:uncharacterized protein YjiS (DUF1127 family)
MAITHDKMFGSSSAIPTLRDFANLVARWATKRSQRRQVVALLTAEPCRLTDLGLTKGDVHDALNAPGSASHNLRILAAKRRREANW